MPLRMLGIPEVRERNKFYFHEMPHNWSILPLAHTPQLVIHFLYYCVQVRERNTFYFHEMPLPDPPTFKNLQALVRKALRNSDSVRTGKRIYR
jgi:hypothetical protein